jgi:hypothetical protein
MANPGKLKNFLVSSIGEIILIVIGILIALQIDNWNQDRLDKIEEAKILQNLHNEFRMNKRLAESAIKGNRLAFQAGSELILLVGENESVLKSRNTDSLLFATFEFYKYDPSENALSDLIQSGRLKFLNDSELKNDLYQWSQQKLVEIDWYKEIETYGGKLMDVLSTIYPIRNIDQYGSLGFKEASKLPNQKYAVFQDLAFENNLHDLLYSLLNDIRELENLVEILERIERKAHTSEQDNG